MDVLAGKVIVLFIFFFSTLFATFLPAYFSKSNAATSTNKKLKVQLLLESCYSIAGGVFLATCFVALLPFVRCMYAKAALDNQPYSEITILVGFFIVVFIEKLVAHKQGSAPKQCSSYEHEEESLISEGTESNHPGSTSKPSIHSHCHDDVGQLKSLLHSVILVVTLGIHTLFEGMSIGLITDQKTLTALTVAVLAHSLCCAVALGINLGQQNISKVYIAIICLVFSLMKPAGISIGIGLGEVQGFTGLVITAVAQGLATGTFMYVLFIEIVPSISSAQNSFIQTCLMLLGCTVMTLVIVFTHDYNNSDMTSNPPTTVMPHNSSSLP